MALRCPRKLAIMAALICGAPCLPAQSTRVQDLGVGKLLVAYRDSRDPAFAETVVLIIHYDHDGTVGLAINRRTTVPISRALDKFAGTKGRTDPIYAGGPVEQQNVLALVKANTMPEGSAHVTGKVYLVSTKALLEKTLAKTTEPGDLRVYLGYCGWGPGQLENETSHGFWHIFPGDADVVFDAEPDTLWKRLIARAGQSIAENRAQARVALTRVPGARFAQAGFR
jgi:putative transcriptional regulator